MNVCISLLALFRSIGADSQKCHLKFLKVNLDKILCFAQKFCGPKATPRRVRGGLSYNCET